MITNDAQDRETKQLPDENEDGAEMAYAWDGLLDTKGHEDVSHRPLNLQPVS